MIIFRFLLSPFLLKSLIINAQYSDKVLQIHYSNDFFTGSDQYFTQGIKIELIHPILKKIPINRLRFGSKMDALHQYGVGITQDAFTPSSIRYDSILKNDRPYCGTLYFTITHITNFFPKKRILSTQLDLGIMGPMALGHEEQTAIHKAIHDELPKGWKHQIQNDVILNYKMDLQQTIVDRKFLELSSSIQSRLGSMYTDFSIGTQCRTGLKNSKFSHSYRQSKLQIFAVTHATCKIVGYNATLQGGLLNRTSPYTIKNKDISRILATYELGLCTMYKKIQINYSRTFITKEFKTGQRHSWGNLSLMLGF